jgi:GR25 family glycosyltransferase involved in LPS biosynthesis
MKIVGIRYINLRKNKWRRIFIFRMLKKTKYKFRRIHGVIYKKDDVMLNAYLQSGVEQYVVESKSQNRAAGIIGCWLAHVKALESIKTTDGLTAIMEDDFAFNSVFFSRALSMIRKFDAPFDVIFFDTRGSGPIGMNPIFPGAFDNDRLCSPSFVGSHCLFINNNSVEKILRIIKSSLVKDYDGFLLNNKDIDTYVFYTGQSMCLEVGSNLDNSFNLFNAAQSFSKWLKLYFN